MAEYGRIVVLFVLVILVIHRYGRVKPQKLRPIPANVCLGFSKGRHDLDVGMHQQWRDVAGLILNRNSAKQWT